MGAGPLLDRLLAAMPSLEVAGRLGYWRSPVLHRLGNIVRSRRRGGRAGDKAPPAAVGDFSAVIASLGKLGVVQGDILVVHSSFAALKPFGLAPEQIIGALRELIGPEGTLVMPSFPIYRGEPEGLARHSDAAFDCVFDYDVASTRIWTGALPKALMRMPGAVRSRCPANPMVAIGRKAEAMMRDNLAALPITPSGPGSALDYCYRQGAKVIALGVDLVHSLTMIHVAEECFPERWPIPDWYRPRRYRVTDGARRSEVIVHERRHGWSQYYPERAFSRDLHAAGIATRGDAAGVEIHYCEALRLVDFLRSHPRPFYPYLFPFGIRRSGRRP